MSEGVRDFSVEELRKWALDTLDVTKYLIACGEDPHSDLMVRMIGSAIKMLAIHPVAFPIVHPIPKRAPDCQLQELHDALQQTQISDESSAATVGGMLAPLW